MNPPPQQQQQQQQQALLRLLLQQQPQQQQPQQQQQQQLGYFAHTSSPPTHISLGDEFGPRILWSSHMATKASRQPARNNIGAKDQLLSEGGGWG